MTDHNDGRWTLFGVPLNPFARRDGNLTVCGVTVNPFALQIVAKVFDRPINNEELDNLRMGGYTTRRGWFGTRVDHAIIHRGNIQNPGDTPVLIRIDSGCFTGGIFHDESCDCHWQLLSAMKRINDAPEGEPGLIIHHFHHEGKAHGWTRKLQSYQDGMYPVSDLRKYRTATLILQDLGIRKARVMTNNPEKMGVFTRIGIEIVEIIHLVTDNPRLREYLEYKRRRWGHQVEFDDENTVLTDPPRPDEPGTTD
jgi:GTP cyclohydrolase II